MPPSSDSGSTIQPAPATADQVVEACRNGAEKEADAASPSSELQKEAEPAGRTEASGGSNRPLKKRPVSVSELPVYARSLLRIKVPVMVTLAEKRQPLGQIVKLGPGSIIQFDKSCDEMLELDVGGRTVAVGEAVKVGDKFGLRISSVVLPDERFRTVTQRSIGGPQGAEPAGRR